MPRITPEALWPRPAPGLAGHMSAVVPTVQHRSVRLLLLLEVKPMAALACSVEQALATCGH